jgi:hypothetical protein
MGESGHSSTHCQLCINKKVKCKDIPTLSSAPNKKTRWAGGTTEHCSHSTGWNRTVRPATSFSIPTEPERRSWRFTANGYTRYSALVRGSREDRWQRGVPTDLNYCVICTVPHNTGRALQNVRKVRPYQRRNTIHSVFHYTDSTVRALLILSPTLRDIPKPAACWSLVLSQKYTDILDTRPTSSV